MENKTISTQKAAGKQQLFAAFVHAWNGMQYFVRTERNARIHIAASIIVLVAAFYLHLTNLEWCVILFCIGWVIMAELINTAIEQVCNILNPEMDIRIKRIKDMAAAAVLFITIISVITGLIIFLPYILSL